MVALRSCHRYGVRSVGSIHVWVSMTSIARNPKSPNAVKHNRFVWKDKDGYLDGKLIVTLRDHDDSGGVLWTFPQTKTWGITESYENARRVVNSMVKRGIVR